MMTDIADQDARIGPMHDEPDVPAHPDRPEPAIPRAIEFVKAQPRTFRVDLKIEDGRLGELLLAVREPSETRGEAARDPEFHQRTGTETGDEPDPAHALVTSASLLVEAILPTHSASGRSQMPTEAGGVSPAQLMRATNVSDLKLKHIWVGGLREENRPLRNRRPT